MKAGRLNYREVLQDYMPVTFDSIDIEVLLSLKEMDPNPKHMDAFVMLDVVE